MLIFVCSTLRGIWLVCMSTIEIDYYYSGQVLQDINCTQGPKTSSSTKWNSQDPYWRYCPTYALSIGQGKFISRAIDRDLGCQGANHMVGQGYYLGRKH